MGVGHTDNPESQLTTQWMNDLRNVCRVEAQGGQFKCCITIEQKKSDVKGLQDRVLATIMSSGGGVCWVWGG